IALIAAAAALAGCGEQKPPAKAEQTKMAPAAAGVEVRIGHVGPLTGGIAHLGKDNENGARLAVEQANAAGIKIDGKDVKFAFLAEDDQADPKTCTTVAQKLVDVIDDATAYGEGIANEVEKTLKAAKIKVLPREKGTDKTTDWKAVLTKLRGRRPDAVFYGGMDATGGPLLKQGRDLGIKAV